MKNTIFILGLALTLFSCGGSSSSESKKKVFKTTNEGSYMIHSSYPAESVKWEKVMATINVNKTTNSVSHSSFVLNFDTENFVNKHKIDSAFVTLTAFPSENYGANKVSVHLLKKFEEVFNWNHQPAIDNNHFSIIKKIDKKVTVDITQLLKISAKNNQFDVPLYFQLLNTNLNESAFASFYSTASKMEKYQPKLEIYYHD